MIYKNNVAISKMYKGSDIVNKINSNIESHTSRLPSGYTEVEYVENTTSAYIDTGFKPNQDTRIVYDVQFVTSTQYPSAIGAGAWNRVNGIRQSFEPNYNGTLHVKYGANTGWTVYSSVVGDYNRHKYDFNKNQFYMDNTLIGSTTYTNFQCTDNLGLFYTIEAGTTFFEDSIFKGKFYSCQIYDNNVIARDFVPCQRESDSKYGFYDLVTNTFFTSASSGSFIGGNPVQPTGSTDVVAFQYIVNEQQQPYDAQVEYLESDGASYIDTGLYLNTSNFEIGYECAGNVADIDHAWGYAHQMVGNGAWVSVVNDKAFFGQYTNTVNISSYIVSGDNTIKYTNSGVTVNGRTFSRTFSLSGVDNLNSVSVPIFSWYDFYSRGMEYSQNLKYKSFYLKNNGELVLDMIPVRKDGVGYMYDRVSGQLFANAGTGSFIIGQDV